MCRCRSSTAEKGGREVSTGEHSLCSQVGRVARAERGWRKVGRGRVNIIEKSQ